MSRVLRACTKSGTTLAVAGIATLSAGVLATPALADPPGHNGDIKIIAVDDLSTPPENNPMQGCTLAIEWYGLDKGDLVSQVSFEAIAPTAAATLTVVGRLEVPVGEDDASGGNDLDAREEYTFTTTGEPGPQGFHVKVTVRTPGAHGPEKKSKVFWIGDCRVDEPPTEEPPREEPPTEEPPTEEPPTEEPPTEEPPTEEPPTEEPPTEEPPVVTPPVGQPVLDPGHPEQVDVDAVLDPVVVPLVDDLDVPTLVDAGETASGAPGTQGGTSHGFVILGGLLLTAGVLLRRTVRAPRV